MSGLSLQGCHVVGAEGGALVVQGMFFAPITLAATLLRHGVLQHHGGGFAKIHGPPAEAQIDYKCDSQLDKVGCLRVDEEVKVAPDNEVSFESAMAPAPAPLLTMPRGRVLLAATLIAAHC
jgi:hypothetical protein